MAAKRNKGNIEIERNVIEQYLMIARDFLKGNSKIVKLSAAGITVFAVLFLSLFVYIEGSASSNFKSYELIIDSYRMNPSDRAVKDKTIADLRALADRTWFGQTHEMSLYMLGNLLYEDEKYEEACEMFNSFMKKSSSDRIFVPVAVIKASVCLEELGKTDDALVLLQKFAEENDDSIVMDQILYNSGRLCVIKGDRLKAKEYFNRVISSYPESAFSERARERLLLLGV